MRLLRVGPFDTFLRETKIWLIGLANQLLWLVWIGVTGTWGLLPLNIALWIVYSRNHLKWRREALG